MVPTRAKGVSNSCYSTIYGKSPIQRSVLLPYNLCKNTVIHGDFPDTLPYGSNFDVTCNRPIKSPVPVSFLEASVH